MPHVLIKLVPGKSEAQKQRLADQITQSIITILGSAEDAVSISMEEIEKQDWADKVYKADIMQYPERLYKKPGYTCERVD